MRAKAWVAGGLVLAVGCAPLQTERRVERGPVLRTYTREVVLGEPALAATVETQWPRLTLRFIRSEVCRTEQHEEFVENVITETYESSAAPALSAGAANTALGAGLLLARPLFSDAPDRDAIDREGRYGASTQDRVRVWGIGLMALGVPALVTGLVQSLRAGEETETRKADAVVSLREAPCRPQPANGTVEFAGGPGVPPEPRPTTDGTLTLTAEELRGMRFEGVLLEGVPVPLTDEDQELLSTFRVCGRLLTEPMDPAVLAQEGVGQLHALRRRVAGCAVIPGAPVQERLNVLDAAISAHGNRAEASDSPRVNSFDEALALYKPSLNLTPDSEDLEKLRDPEALAGQAVLLRGVLERYEGQNIAVLQVGSTRVLVFLEPDRPWASDIRRGSRVELVGVVVGRQRLGELESPLLRAVWMRTAI